MRDDYLDMINLMGKGVFQGNPIMILSNSITYARDEIQGTRMEHGMFL